MPEFKSNKKAISAFSSDWNSSKNLPSVLLYRLSAGIPAGYIEKLPKHQASKRFNKLPEKSPSVSR